LSYNLRKFGRIRRFRKFTPHITLTYKDITRENFKKAFKEFKKRKISFEFKVNRLYIGKSKTRIKVSKSFRLKV
jgi:2'-5' RNA ligase